jgi:hypothetical protein
VWFRKTPRFDLLEGQETPFEGFGDVLPDSESRESTFADVLEEVLAYVHEVFKVNLDDPCDRPAILERTIAQMWQEGWRPEIGDVNLFTRDFGVILAASMRDLLGGKLVFRSECEMDHLSIWWEGSKLEAFPFHKTYKRLTSQEGESIDFFFRAIRKMLSLA